MNNVHKMDLNLLRAFVTVYAKGSVTEAALEVGVTQSAMSHMLGRLRRLLGEPLFVRQGRGVTPTRTADRLYGPISRALGEMEAALRAAGRFEPASESRTFVLALPDYVEIICLPKLLAALSKAAPHAAVECVDPGDLPPADYLGEVDLAIAHFGSLPPQSHRQTLWREPFVTVRAARHPRIQGDTLTLARFLAEGHIMVGSRGDRPGAVDRALAERGRTRRIAVKTGYFQTPARLAAQSDLLATVPASLAGALADELGLQVHAPPIPVPGFDVSMVWSDRNHGDPGHRWLRQIVRMTLRGSPSGQAE